MAAEKNFENKVKKYLEEQECWFVKFHANSYTKKGVPDILCCFKGKFIGIEIKASNGRPSVLQLRNLKGIEDAGGWGILLYPEYFENFKNFIGQLKCGQFSNAWDEYEILKRKQVKFDAVFTQQD